MKLTKLVWKELFERKSQVVTGLLAILLGITVIVAIKNITFYSEKAVAQELDALGANILVLPKSVTLQNYYSADMQGDEFPEEYVERLTQSNLQGVDNLVSQAVASGGDSRSQIHAHRDLAQKRVSGKSRVADGRSVLSSRRLRNRRRHSRTDSGPTQGNLGAYKSYRNPEQH